MDAEHALIVAQQVTTESNDERSLLPMAEAAKHAVGDPASLNVVADAGYSNGEQAQACEAQGIVPHVPVQRGVNNRGDGSLFDRSQFTYDENSDTLRCPAQQTLRRKQVQPHKKRVVYMASPQICGNCPLKSQCTNAPQRCVQRHLYEEALQRMQQRTKAEIMRWRRCLAEHPFAALKYHIFGHPRFLLRGRMGAQTEMSLATLAYNLKRMLKVLGGVAFRAALAS